MAQQTDSSHMAISAAAVRLTRVGDTRRALTRRTKRALPMGAMGQGCPRASCQSTLAAHEERHWTRGLTFTFLGQGEELLLPSLSSTAWVIKALPKPGCNERRGWHSVRTSRTKAFRQKQPRLAAWCPSTKGTHAGGQRAGCAGHRPHF